METILDLGVGDAFTARVASSELGIEGTYPRIASWIEREQNAANVEGRARSAQLSAAVRLHDLASALEIAPTGLTTHQSDMERFRKNLREAAIRTNKERCARLPLVGKNPSASTVQKEIDRRAGDWSEVRPEWGLSGNASFIIGRRSLTQDIDLEGRAFLNNYDYREDPTGTQLQGILGAPCVVGQWINSEHYFSATDPEVYGAGSKIYHNVVGRIGIMAGPQSDLRTGLAWQSVMKSTMPYHEPLRLLVVAEAPRERLIKALENLPHVQALFDNEWIHLVAVDPEEENPLYRYEPGLKWASLSQS